MDGMRVGVVDTDVQSPGIHVLFNMDESQMVHSLNDYLWGKCTITDTAVNVTKNLKKKISGSIHLIPSSIKAGEIARVLREGYDVGLLNDGFQDLISALNLDVLVIDTHPGLNEETLLSIAISDALAVIMRPDQQDYQGTSVTVEIARKLGVPNMYLVVNKVPQSFDQNQIKAKVESIYNCDVAVIIPHSEEIMTLASAGIFTLEYPDHPIAKLYKQLAARLLA
jgi:MinD-like ATPase involved in chromosome partitioning or flagellar assembly